MAAVELVKLIDLSLGSQPCGVVNFNYLHGLLHEIVKRLADLEDLRLQPWEGGGGGGGSGWTPLSSPARQQLVHHHVGASPSHVGASPSHVSAGTSLQTLDEKQEEGSGGGGGGGGEGGEGTGSDGAAREGKGANEQTDGKEAAVPTQPADPSASQSSMVSTRPVSSVRSRGGLATAANELSALERRLQALEGRVHTMESLPELLERKASDSTATPVSDMWQFTSLGKRLDGAEDGIDKVGLYVVRGE